MQPYPTEQYPTVQCSQQSSSASVFSTQKTFIISSTISYSIIVYTSINEENHIQICIDGAKKEKLILVTLTLFVHQEPSHQNEIIASQRGSKFHYADAMAAETDRYTEEL